MIESTDLDRIASDVRTAAEACGALIVDAILSIESQSVPVAAVSGSDFPALIKHLRPRLVYLSVVSFDAKDCAEMAVEGADEESVEFMDLIASWNGRNGKTHSLTLGVMGDGVLHGIVEVADWFEEFEAEAEALAECHRATAEDNRAAMLQELDRIQEAERVKADREERIRLAPLIKKLLADPRFLAPKTSVAKRVALAEALFPDLDLTTLRKIVERANSELWLMESS